MEYLGLHCLYHGLTSKIRHESVFLLWTRDTAMKVQPQLSSEINCGICDKFVSLQLVFKVKLLWLVSRVNNFVNSISLWWTENENAGCLSNNMQGLFHVSCGCLKITGLFLTWVRFQNCGVKQWETIIVLMFSIWGNVQ